jgi:transposase
VRRHLHEEALQRMQPCATPEAMRLRRSTVEHPFATLKYRIFGQGRPRFLLRGIANVLGGGRLRAALAG